MKRDIPTILVPLTEDEKYFFDRCLPPTPPIRLGVSLHLALEALFDPKLLGFVIPDAIVTQAMESKELHHVIALNGGLLILQVIFRYYLL